MVEAVLAIDMGDEVLKSNETVKAWFEERGCVVAGETISIGKVDINYSVYQRTSVTIFRFENEEDNFPVILLHFISDLQDKKGTSVSVAEETQFGYQTLVELNLQDFIKHIMTEDDDDDLIEESGLEND
tara:strand:- start:1390 stop:1776 length:387 start_codon:yes stop_codon:yes gene_type:complete